MDNPRAAVGRFGEEYAQQLLEREGYRIVDANVRFGNTSGIRGELDIVAWDGPTLCFIEVKTRQARRGEDIAPAEAVDFRKRQQIAALAVAYAQKYDLLEGDTPLRYDVVAITVTGREPSLRVVRADLIRGAFMADE